jgi:hypothetical protein
MMAVLNNEKKTKEKRTSMEAAMGVGEELGDGERRPGRAS